MINLRKIHILLLVDLCWTWMCIKYKIIQQSIRVIDIYDSCRFMLDMEVYQIPNYTTKHNHRRFILGMDMINLRKRHIWILVYLC